MSTSTLIMAVHAQEILDSRGNPTLTVTVELGGGLQASASVPSGASTGANEAVELRDGDASRYGGKGVRKAVVSVEQAIADAVRGLDALDQAALDHRLIDLDGTSNKARLGANAMLGVSMAVARAAAAAQELPLYAYLGGRGATLLPMPSMNVLNGGKHADSGLDFQEFMIVPVGAPSFAEAMRFGAETYAALRRLLRKDRLSTAVGDEGGFAPALPSNEAACDYIVAAIEEAGYKPGVDVAIALDPAASSFGSNGSYYVGRNGGRIDRAGLLELYGRWIETYPIVSIEDGFAEDDWQGFVDQNAAQGGQIQVMGDDITVTNPRFIQEAIERKAMNAVLIKLNQIGTVTETVSAVNLCHRTGWKVMVSHRSGETIDSFIADFAVATAAGQIKSGAPCRGERLAKYNRLMVIERELGDKAVFANPFANQPRLQERVQ
ncbi:phosphopyruvate hydratase [Sphingomonas sp. H39-1-10]|uniref:phosphopyruvate hydratase n=1 Tax=Sphingomonas pollutisoli TaxID=3030829 RepID=UPI0023B9374E|nr:phosphopyruvate hydratase [Sphingomonas pollutisoli]MDF0490536.1 phosphopyruvate hydratase [Sphingomonas pollutisoli]